MRRSWPLTARGTVAAVLAVACFIGAGALGAVQLVAFGLLLCVLVAGAVLSLHLARREVTVARSLSQPSAQLGERLRVTVHVTVRTALPTTPGVWEDVMPAGLRGRSDGRFPAMGSGLRGGDRAVDLVYEAEGAARGVHWLGPLELSVRDPFGIAKRTALVGDATRVTVTPECVPLAPLSAGGAVSGRMLHTTSTRFGQGSDNLIARPWEPGDSMRRIHWRATAHRDRIMVRQEEAESAPEAVVILDRAIARWPAVAADRTGADPSFEAALSACVSAVNALVHDGYTVHVADGEGAPLAAPIAGGDAAGAAALAARLAPATTSGAAGPAAIAQAWSGVSTGPLVLVTGVVGSEDAAALSALPRRSTHPVLLAAGFAPDAQRRAADDGWHAASCAPGVDLAASWLQVSQADVAEDRRVDA